MKAYAARMAEHIRRGEKTHVPRFNTGGVESKHTTQVCVMDDRGECGDADAYAGAAVRRRHRGPGVHVQRRDGGVRSSPGSCRVAGAGEGTVLRVVADHRVRAGETPFLVLGAPGATYITMGNLQAMLNAIEFGMDAQQAVSAPRFAAVSDTIEVSNRILHATERALHA